jgi:hypothetical protein
VTDWLRFFDRNRTITALTVTELLQSDSCIPAAQALDELRETLA